MKFAIRKVLLLAVGFHILAFLYVAEILKKNHQAVSDVKNEVSPDDIGSAEISPNDTISDETLLADLDIDFAEDEEPVDIPELDSRIKAIEALLQPSLDALSNHYDQYNERATRTHDWHSIILKQKRVHGNEYNMLNVLERQFPNIEFLPVVLDVDLLKQYLLPYYFQYSTSNCTASPFGLKKDGNLLKWTYNASCKASIADTLKPVSFTARTRSLRIWNYAGYLKDPSKIMVTYLIIASDAVVDKYGDVSTSNVTIVPERCDALKGWGATVDIESIPQTKHIFSMHQKFGRDATRNSLEGLPRIAPYVKFLREHPEVKVQSAFSNVLLELLTISLKRLEQDTVRGEQVYQPAGTHCQLPSLFNTQLMSFYLRSGLQNTPEKKDVILFIKPGDRVTKAYHDLYDELFSLAKVEAKKKNLLVIEYTTIGQTGLGMTRQLFNRAVIVIAVRGNSALSNMYFSQPGTVLIEGQCTDEADYSSTLNYAAFAQTLAFRYYAVLQRKNCFTHLSVSEFAKPLLFYLENLQKVIANYEF